MSQAPSRGDTAVTATIAASGTVSNAIDLRACSAFGIILPATFTGTALSFQVSHDNATFVALNDNSGAISITVAQNKAYVAPAALAPFPFVKLVSGSTEGSERLIRIVRLR